MQSTDRLQVRDLIEKLSGFDPKARVTGAGFELVDVSKGDDCLVYLEIDRDEELVDLEERVESLESECGGLEDEVSELKKANEEFEEKLRRIKNFAELNPEKLAKFILEGE